MKNILELLENDARLTNSQIANKLGLPIKKVEEAIKKAEADQTILKYTAIVNWAKLGNEMVWALIEIRLT